MISSCVLAPTMLPGNLPPTSRSRVVDSTLPTSNTWSWQDGDDYATAPSNHVSTPMSSLSSTTPGMLQHMYQGQYMGSNQAQMTAQMYGSIPQQPALSEQELQYRWPLPPQLRVDMGWNEGLPMTFPGELPTHSTYAMPPQGVSGSIPPSTGTMPPFFPTHVAHTQGSSPWAGNMASGASHMPTPPYGSSTGATWTPNPPSIPSIDTATFAYSAGPSGSPGLAMDVAPAHRQLDASPGASPVAHTRSASSSRRHSPVSEGHASTSERPRSSSQTPCCWGGFCGASLDKLPIAAISHHLKEVHMDRATWDGRARAICQWTSGGAACGMELYYDNIAKHIASVHLGSTALACPYCDKKFSRGDSLCRHVREACRFAQ